MALSQFRKKGSVLVLGKQRDHLGEVSVYVYQRDEELHFLNHQFRVVLIKLFQQAVEQEVRQGVELIFTDAFLSLTERLQDISVR